MINVIWMGLLLIGMAVSAWTGKMDVVTQAVFAGAKAGITVTIGLLSFLVFWLGMMKIAEEAGLVQSLARLLWPIVRFLFPSVPPDHPALGSILANMSANILGLGNAATPLGLKAMKELQELNPDKKTASDAMCTLLAINTANITIIPATVIFYRSQFESANPTEIVGATIIATALGTAVAVILDRWFRKRESRRGGGPGWRS
ncbi:spore maturation protein A [Collibacillus ludicampi]|jgi:spore maturation protein A|uniref:Spore maturation protein A n=1 Tax=Collibacillus ludicampi TaxID=2771369 RepID=A0AAV4LMD5_9BACL|nr:nucleoside recognition domain-containing protein [Collibacillus ludicampi]GIM48267.1 spore maturation protein A [Collibacillus ludicampi]GIM48546.1 spore maturation protein A [Collibacillus ludicampi]